MRIAALIGVLVIAAVLATYARYESLDPCAWLERDMVLETGLPSIVVQTKIKADFLVEGIADPDAYDCLRAWWRFKFASAGGEGS